MGLGGTRIPKHVTDYTFPRTGGALAVHPQADTKAQDEDQQNTHRSDEHTCDGEVGTGREPQHRAQ